VCVFFIFFIASVDNLVMSILSTLYTAPNTFILVSKQPCFKKKHKLTFRFEAIAFFMNETIMLDELSACVRDLSLKKCAHASEVRYVLFFNLIF
jgi:hypothetical protein